MPPRVHFGITRIPRERRYGRNAASRSRRICLEETPVTSRRRGINRNVGQGSMTPESIARPVFGGPPSSPTWKKKGTKMFPFRIYDSQRNFVKSVKAKAIYRLHDCCRECAMNRSTLFRRDRD